MRQRSRHLNGIIGTFRRLRYAPILIHPLPPPPPIPLEQDLARREQDRRDSDAWLTVQRLKRAKVVEEKEAARKAKVQGKDWRDPEDGVDIGMGRREPTGLNGVLEMHADVGG